MASSVPYMSDWIKPGETSGMSDTELGEHARAKIRAIKTRFFHGSRRAGQRSWDASNSLRYLDQMMARIRSLFLDPEYSQKAAQCSGDKFRTSLSDFRDLNRAVYGMLKWRHESAAVTDPDVISLFASVYVVLRALEHAESRFAKAILKEVFKELRGLGWEIPAEQF
ncbi:hypothetical protein QBC44DRAFT_311641 [Cladorrhinum sp. PSN332]|nr:hypothetical protein QBC44DRAFT_311641 [Cladorrhinum sp. PSN332]